MAKSHFELTPPTASAIESGWIVAGLLSSEVNFSRSSVRVINQYIRQCTLDVEGRVRRLQRKIVVIVRWCSRGIRIWTGSIHHLRVWRKLRSCDVGYLVEFHSCPKLSSKGREFIRCCREKRWVEDGEKVEEWIMDELDWRQRYSAGAEDHCDI